ncbi:MAG: TIGR03435 family protein [Terracidiphilus sp.]
MTGPSDLGPKASVLLAALCLAVVAPALAQPGAAPPAAPSPDASAPYTPTLTFDVASIRRSPPAGMSYSMGGSFVPGAGIFRATNVGVEYIIGTAYQTGQFYRITGVPRAIGSVDFDVEAKAGSEAEEKLAHLSPEEVKLEQQHMLKVLLADRFNLKVHWETVEGDVYNLTVRSDSKLLQGRTEAPSPETLQNLGAMGDNPEAMGDKTPDLYQVCDGSGCRYVGHQCSIQKLLSMAQYQLGRAVIDKTGLTGSYDFTLRYSGTRTSDPEDSGTSSLPTLETALEEQLGLKLESAKGPVKVLVVDHVEMPSAN